MHDRIDILLKSYSKMSEKSKDKMPCSTLRKLTYASLNTLSAAGVISLVLLVQLGIIDNFKSGFYCKDPGLSFKFNADTVTGLHLFLGTFLMPLLLITLFELVRSYDAQTNSFNDYFSHLGKVLKKWYGGYCSILLLNFLAIEVFKFVFGNPRPHFFDTCAPSTGFNCTTGIFVRRYECTSGSYPHWLVIDSYRSFLSGHAAISVYAGLFSFWYIEKRGSRCCPRLLCVVFQVLALSFSIVCSITRITDHRHHWWDVVCGAILGALLTPYAVLRYCDNFKLQKHPYPTLQDNVKHCDIEAAFANKNYKPS